MRNRQTALLLAICMVSILFSGCKKDDGIKGWLQAYVDVPFEIAPNQPCYLNDTILNTQTGKIEKNRIEVRVNSIIDNRAFGVDCMSTYGSAARVNGTIKYNNDSKIDYSFSMPGCTNNEWTLNNNNIPRKDVANYSLYLLKLNPYDSKPKKEKDYSVKFIIKRNI